MRALVLSGGAAKGAYQVGVLKHLLGDLQIKYDLMCGISVGAINAAYLGMFPHGEEMKCIAGLSKLWYGLTSKDIYVSWVNLPKPLHYLGYIVALFKSSLYNSAPLEDLVRKHYVSDRIAHSGKKVRVGAVSLNTGEYRMFTEAYPDMPAAILASSSFPMAFKPIKIDGQFWSDGGIKEITPLKSAIIEGATEIDVIMTNPEHEMIKQYEESPKLLKLGPRVLDIMSEEILDNDLSRALEINKLIQNGAKIPNKKYIPIRIYRPEETLMKNSLLFEQEFIKPMIETGYAQAKKMTGA
jgi:NTE family protein